MEKEPPVRTHRRLRLVLAAILGKRNPMARPEPVRLREAPGRPAPDAPVIDVPYVEVRKKRGLLRKLWLALVAVFWAAVIGFLIPPTWVLIQEIGAMFAPAP